MLASFQLGVYQLEYRGRYQRTAEIRLPLKLYLFHRNIRRALHQQSYRRLHRPGGAGRVRRWNRYTFRGACGQRLDLQGL